MHTCTECGHEYSVDFAFCTGCGAVNPLRAQSAAPSEKAQALGGIGRLEDSEPIDISFSDERTSEPAQAESLVTFHSDEEQLAALELRLSKLEIEGEKLTAD
jgi:hypothetical protein